MGDGRQEMEDGRRETGDGRWETGGGRQEVGGGRCGKGEQGGLPNLLKCREFPTYFCRVTCQCVVIFFLIPDTASCVGFCLCINDSVTR